MSAEQDYRLKMPAAKEQQNGLLTTDAQPVLDPSSLPSATDPGLTLEPANAVEYEHTWRLNCSEWKGFLSDSSYLDRELLLAEAEVAAEGGATAWILTSSKLPTNEDGSRPILASCETNRKTAYISKNGRLEKVISHGIGSVHSPAHYRGRGYGVKMIQELDKKLDTYQQLKSNTGRFSVLYSDIGPKFYAKHGWKAFPSTHISLKPIANAGEYHQRVAEITPKRTIEDLRVQDLAVVAPVCIQALEKRLEALSLETPNKTFVSYQPSLAQLQWHFTREEFLADYLGRKRPVVKGARDAETGACLIWTRTYAADSAEWHLSILYTHIPRPYSASDATNIEAALSALLLRAQWEAKQWDMAQGVELWDPSEEVISAAEAIAHGQAVKVISRDQEHICSLKWNGLETDEVIWVANERFAWC